MHRLLSITVCLLACAGLALAQTNTAVPVNAGPKIAQLEGDIDPLVSQIQAELAGPIPVEGKVDPAVPKGEVLQGKITDPEMYPGTENKFSVYVPAQYDPAQPACLMVRLDGISDYECTVLDNLIAKKAIPVISRTDPQDRPRAWWPMASRGMSVCSPGSVT